MRYTPTHSDEKREPLCPGGCLWVSVGVTGYGRSSPWRGRQGGRMLLRPYPDGRKIGTLKRCGFKKQSCLFDRQGRGVLHTPSNRARQGPGACLVFGGGLTPTSPHLLFLFVYMNRQGRGVSNTSYRGQGIAFCRSMDVPGCRGAKAYALQTPPTVANTCLAFVPLAGTLGRAYAIRPYPFGRKKGTLKRCGFKK